MIKSSKIDYYVAVFFIVILQIIISFQGFDVCDEGFSLTFYQQIYNAPLSVEYNFAYWLSGIVGGAWYSINKEGGVLWFRILTVLFNTVIFIVCYEILNKYINKQYVLIGLIIVLFVNNYGYTVFYHNHLTALLAVSSVYFLLIGLKKTRKIFLFISGLLLGINIFSRLPNITLLAFILSIPFLFYIRNNKLKDAIKPMLCFIVGGIVGVVFVILIMFLLGHLEIMKNSLLSVFTLGKTKDSTHNIETLFYTYLNNYKKVAKLFFKLVIICSFILCGNSYFKSSKLVKIILNIVALFLFTFFFKNEGIHVVYVLGLTGTIGVLCIKNQNIYLKTIALLGLCMMIFIPLGSAGGMYDVGYICIWLAIPLFFHFFYQIGDFLFVSSFVSKSAIKSLLLVMVVSYFIAKTYNISQEAYFDKGTRFEKNHSINNKHAQGIYTTKERANVINDLLVNLEIFVKPNDYLLVYDNMPMIHFLTETKPYMYNPWVWVYDSYSFNEKIKKAENEIPILPIVVQQKFQTISSFSKPVLDYMSETKENSFLYNGERMAVMNDFIKRNEYKIVWSNPYFNIFKSSKNRE